MDLSIILIVIQAVFTHSGYWSPVRVPQRIYPSLRSIAQQGRLSRTSDSDLFPKTCVDQMLRCGKSGFKGPVSILVDEGWIFGKVESAEGFIISSMTCQYHLNLLFPLFLERHKYTAEVLRIETKRKAQRFSVPRKALGTCLPFFQPCSFHAVKRPDTLQRKSSLPMPPSFHSRSHVGTGRPNE